jgi:hypothetical protein
MEIVGPASEDDMVAAFVRAELDSTLFGPMAHDAASALGIRESVLRDGDNRDPAVRDARRKVLAAYRGYTVGTALFTGFPRKVEWVWVTMSHTELQTVRYVNEREPSWTQHSGGTRVASDAARRALNGELPASFTKTLKEMAEGMKAGRAQEPMVFVSKADGSGVVAMEGHKRLTVYLMYPDLYSENWAILLGRSDHIARWAYY